MPVALWSYCLAVTLSAVVGDAWFSWFVGQHVQRKSWLARRGPTSFIWMLTTGGSLLLSRWHGVADGALVGLCWTVGFTVGIAFAEHRIVWNIVRSVGGNSGEHWPALLGVARLYIGREGVEATEKRVRARLGQLQRTKRKQLQGEREELVAANERLESHVGDLISELSTSENARRQQGDEIIRLTTVASIASRDAAAHGDQWNPVDALQLVVDNVSRLFGGPEAARVGLFVFGGGEELAWPLVNTRGQALASRYSGRPLRADASLAGAAVHFGHIIVWPEDATENANLREWYEQRESTSRWSRCVAIPIPFRNQGSDSVLALPRYGALCVGLPEDSVVWAEGPSQLALCYASLIDLFIAMSGVEATALANVAKQRWSRRIT